MSEISPYSELQAAILSAEASQEASKQALFAQLKDSYDSFKPFNLFKKSLAQFSESTELKKGLIALLFTFGASMLNKKIPSPIRNNKLVEAGGDFIRKHLFRSIIQNPQLFSTIGLAVLHSVKNFRTEKRKLRQKSTE